MIEVDDFIFVFVAAEICASIAPKHADYIQLRNMDQINSNKTKVYLRQGSSGMQ